VVSERERHLSDVTRRAVDAGAGDDAFAGAGFDEKAGEVYVWRVGGGNPPAQASRAARYTDLADKSAPVRVLPAVISAKQAGVLTEALDRDHEALKAAGIRLQAYGIHRGGGPFEIWIPDAQRHEETLLRRYGDAFFGRHTVRVIEETVVPLAGRPNGSTRLST
jgi:hypothetical protein